MRKASALLVFCALGLAACGAVTDPDDVTPEVYVEQPVVDDAAVAAFGDTEVDQAFAEITELSLQEGYSAELLRDPRDRSHTATELAGDLETWLTTDALEVWRELTASAAEGEQSARHAVQAVRFFDIEEPSWRPVPDQGPIVRQRITDAEIGLATAEGETVLEVTFAHTATLQYLNGNDATVEPEVRKDLTYQLTPAPAGRDVEWLIADFDGNYSFPAREESD